MKSTQRSIFSVLILVIMLMTLNIYIVTSSTSLLNLDDNHQENTINIDQSENLMEFMTSTESLTNYTLDLVLDSSKHYLTGTLLVDYVNSENIIMDKLYFHLFPNASVNEDIPGYLLVNSVQTEDQLQDLEFAFGNQLLNLTLPQPVLPDETISFWIEFETAITNNDSYRLNYNDNSSKGLVYALCNYYPILAVFDADGWNLEPQYFVGDPFYSDVANYYVNLTVPSDFIIASSGELIRQSAEFAGQIEYNYQLLKARDFSFAISPDYITESDAYNSISVTVYYLPQDAGNWSGSALDVALYSLQLFTNLYGSYPYSSFSVATTFGFYGGMEWPGLVYIQSEYEWMETVIAHEIAHQWFYGVVGNDQIDEGFLDEGIVCYNHWYYFEERYGWTGFFDEHLWRTAETSNEFLFPEGLVINRSINYIIENNINSSHYWESAYHKAPSVFHLLRTYIGDDNFFSGLRRYYTQHSFQIATFNDLIESFNYYTNIDWFLPWFNEGYIPEVEIVAAQLEETATNAYNLSITVKQVGLSVYATKIPFLISFSSGDDTLQWVWSNSTTPSTSYILLDKKPVSLTSDLSSGYLYSKNLLEMEPFSIQDNRKVTVPWSILSSVIVYLVFVTIGIKRRKK